METKHKNSHANNHIHDDIEKIKSAFMETTHDAKHAVDEIVTQYVKDAKQKISKVSGDIVEYTAERPLKSAGIAFCAGLIIGYLFRK